MPNQQHTVPAAPVQDPNVGKPQPQPVPQKKTKVEGTQSGQPANTPKK
jgi:hypothetical protein